MIDVRGEVSLAGYDGFGRITSITKPDPSQVGVLSPLPSMTVQYFVTTDPGHHPYSYVHTQTQDGSNPGVASYHDTWTYVDGLGRTLITLPGGGSQCGRRRAVDRGRRRDVRWQGCGAVRLLALVLQRSPDVFPLTAAATTAYKRMRYDAFGHTVQSFNLDGSIAAQIVFHALSVDAWDAEDLAPGPHTGPRPASATTATGASSAPSSGSGSRARSSSTTPGPRTCRPARSRASRACGWGSPMCRSCAGCNTTPRAQSPERRPEHHGGPDAAPGHQPEHVRRVALRVRRRGRFGGHQRRPRVRGELLLRHRRPCAREDYSPCLSSHADYSPPDFSTGIGIETAYLYDAADPESAALERGHPGLSIRLQPPARQAGVRRGSRRQVLFQYDGRGRTTGIGKRIASRGRRTTIRRCGMQPAGT